MIYIYIYIMFFFYFLFFAIFGWVSDSLLLCFFAILLLRCSASLLFAFLLYAFLLYVLSLFLCFSASLFPYFFTVLFLFIVVMFLFLLLNKAQNAQEKTNTPETNTKQGLKPKPEKSTTTSATLKQSLKTTISKRTETYRKQTFNQP